MNIPARADADYAAPVVAFAGRIGTPNKTTHGRVCFGMFAYVHQDVGSASARMLGFQSTQV